MDGTRLFALGPHRSSLAAARSYSVSKSSCIALPKRSAEARSPPPPPPPHTYGRVGRRSVRGLVDRAIKRAHTHNANTQYIHTKHAPFGGTPHRGSATRGARVLRCGTTAADRRTPRSPQRRRQPRGLLPLRGRAGYAVGFFSDGWCASTPPTTDRQTAGSTDGRTV